MRKIAVFILFHLSSFVWGQGTYVTGILPSLNINQKLADPWRINYKIESRLSAAKGDFSESFRVVPRHLLTDVSALISRKTGLNNTLAAGYLIRLEEGGAGHRLLQQYTMVRKYTSFRVGHRIATDQTFIKNEPTEVRLRYRVAFDIPLNGQEVDDGEFYLKLNQELLNSWRGGSYDLEVRLVPLLGYAINDANKVELGLDYRLRRFLKGGPSDQSLWMPVTWFISF